MSDEEIEAVAKRMGLTKDQLADIVLKSAGGNVPDHTEHTSYYEKYKNVPGMLPNDIKITGDYLSGLGKDIKNSFTDIDPLLQLGLVENVFGNSTPLNQYYTNKNSQDNAALQRAYQDMIREENQSEIDQKEAEADKVEQQNKLNATNEAIKNTQDVLAKAYKDYNDALVNNDSAAADVASKQIAYYQNKLKQLGGEDIYGQGYTEELQKDNVNRQTQKTYAEKLEAMIPSTLKNTKTKQEWIDRIQSELDKGNISQDQAAALYSKISGKGTYQEKSNDAAHATGDSIRSEKAKKYAEDKDLQDAASTAIKSNTPPSNLDNATRDKVRAMGYSWDGRSKKWQQK